MKMVDLKLPKQTKNEMELTAKPSMEQNRWPYGMQLRFESEQVDKLPQLKEMKNEEKVTVSGIGEITDVRTHELKGGKKQYTIKVQMQQIGIEGKGKSSRETMAGAMDRYKKNNTMGMKDED